MANRLAAETSPYLLQHADNPVDWYPWGPEAFARAAGEDRPVFLSVGYAACHWCHVMERESFENAATAARLNADFVAIKVDREERPDVDSIYMAAVQAMTRSGGWPMSVFLTPDGRPFYGGTYFPAEPRYGMPSFGQILEAVARAWRERRDEVENTATELAVALRRQQQAMASGAGPGSGPGPGSGGPGGSSESPTIDSSPVEVAVPRLEPRVVETAAAQLGADADMAHGGWGGAPKFPQPAALELLLRRYRAAGDARALGVARAALEAMAAGGIHDQLGGGFHRYSTDAAWLVPHFEKMLYDNAQLARVYLHAYEATGEARFRAVAEATLDYMARELLTPDGLFAASQDADTDGVEGATYTWTPDELDGLGRDGPLFAAAYGVTEAGPVDGRSVLSRALDDSGAATRFGLPVEEAGERLAAARRAVLAVRAARAQPPRDDKAIAAWNGLALAAFADAATVLGRPADLDVAEHLADAVLRLLRGADGRLARSYRFNRRSGQGLLEDYAFVAAGLLALYEATFDERWLRASRELMTAVGEHFADPAGGWFDTADDHEQLLLRPKDLQDGPTPCGNSAAADVLLRLSLLTGDGDQRAAAERAIENVQPFLAPYPLGFAGWLLALDFALAPVAEIAIAGAPGDEGTRRLIGVARDGFQPYRILAVGDPASSSVELLGSRFRIRDRATAFVCHNFSCRQPVTEPEALAAQLS